MKSMDVDVAIIGAGTAGLSAYKAAVKAATKAATKAAKKAETKTSPQPSPQPSPQSGNDPSVVMIEGGPYGTTCARVGCMPSKLLIAAAEAAHTASHMDAFGVHVDGEIRVNGKEVMDRVKRERDRFVGFVLDGVENIPAEHKLRGYARFVAPGVLEVDDHTRINAKTVVIATGSSPSVPPPFKPLGDRLIINDDVFEWHDLPKRVVVFGPGVIGLELGQALARLGVTVRVFGKSGSLAGITDLTVRQAAKKIFQDEFYLDPDARVLETKRVGDEVEVRYVRLDNEECVERFDYALVATGRKPNLAELGLDNAGIEVDAQGIPPFNRETLQVGDLPVFIAGDVNNDVPLLHEAADEGHIAGMNAANFPDVKAGKRTIGLGIVFTDPQIASVGLGPDKLEKGTFVTGELDFTGQGRSRVMLKNKGLMHIYADIKTRRFVGAQMAGPACEHLAHLLAWSGEQGMTIDQMLAMPFYHPVIEEGLRTALRDTAAKLDRA